MMYQPDASSMFAVVLCTMVITAIIVFPVAADDIGPVVPPEMITVEASGSSPYLFDDFLIARYETTVGQFSRFVEDTGYRTDAETIRGASSNIRSKDDRSVFGTAKGDGSWRKPYFNQAPDHPVVGVSYRDAAAFCNWLSELEGFAPFYSGSNFETVDPAADGYRLPTELEWVYAATSGGQSHTYSGPGGKLTGNVADERFRRSFSARMGEIWMAYDDEFVYTAPVGSFAPNEIGIHDMTGNVHELLNDWYGRDFPPADSGSVLIWGPGSGSKKAYRGGAWDSGGFNSDETAIAVRHSIEPFSSDNRIGFRVARTVASTEPTQIEPNDFDLASIDFFLPEDLLRSEITRFDINGGIYTICGPVGITSDGINTITTGDIWSSLTGGNTLDDTGTRRSVYADVMYAIATTPRLNEFRLELFEPVASALGESSEVGDYYDRVMLAYEIVACSDLRYVPDSGTLAQLINRVKTAGRFARRTTGSGNWEMAKDALLYLEAVRTVTGIVKDSVMLNALATDDALWRLETLRAVFLESPIADQATLLAGIDEAAGRLEKNQAYWHAFAESMVQNGNELANLGFAVGVKALSAKAAALAGSKAAGVLVNVWAVPVAIGIAEYQEISGLTSSIQRAVIGGYLTQRLFDSLGESVEMDAKAAGRGALDDLLRMTLYGQYACYEELNGSMSGMLASIASAVWEDIGRIGSFYAIRRDRAFEALFFDE